MFGLRMLIESIVRNRQAMQAEVDEISLASRAVEKVTNIS